MEIGWLFLCLWLLASLISFSTRMFPWVSFSWCHTQETFLNVKKMCATLMTQGASGQQKVAQACIAFCNTHFICHANTYQHKITFSMVGENKFTCFSFSSIAKQWIQNWTCPNGNIVCIAHAYYHIINYCHIGTQPHEENAR